MLQQVVGRVVRQPAGEFGAGGVAERNHVPFAKTAFDVDDADGQQAFALLLDRLAGAGVDDQACRAAGR